MSDTSTLTRCPHCQTRFRVTEKQLGAAGGKVRCGQCREVFNALENAESDAPEPEPVQPEQEEPTSTADEQPTTDAAPSADSSQQNTDDAPSGDDEDEELVFDDNPEEDAREGRYAGKKSSLDESEFDEEFLALERGESLAFSEFLDDTGDQSQYVGEDDESWAESLLQDDDWDMPDPRPLESEDQEAAYREMLEGTGETEPEPQPRTPPADGTDSDSHSSAEPEGDWRSLRTEPIAAPRSERPSWFRRLLWPALALVAAAALVHQLGWAHWDRLTRYEPIRPVYAQVCEWIGCELPPLQAIDQIQSRQMVVRSHPEHDNALLVEATLLNQARFEQPFPAIALSFANLNNDVVAQRVFQPRDYLPDGASPDDTIPAGTGVRVSLSLQDPGRDAINYRLDFLPAQ